MTRLNNLDKDILKIHKGWVKYILPYSYMVNLAERTAKQLDYIFFQQLNLLNIKSLIECGAYEATASIMANKVGINALAIEANPETFEKITPKQTKKFLKINCGLGDKNETLDFYVPQQKSRRTGSTFIPKKDENYFIKKVPIKKLDDVILNYSYVSSPFALWIDVEGMQKQVLKGGGLYTAKSKLQND